MRRGYIIAIDGPVAAGKGTITPKLASNISGFYLYTGAMYRSLALLALQKHVDRTNEQALLSLCEDLSIEFVGNRILLNGTDVTDSLKTPDVAAASSDVAILPLIREAMLRKQRDVARNALEKGISVVAEGRDTGTRLFPDADVKIFLTASPTERAERRIKQYRAQGVQDITFESVLAEIHKRDMQDQTRETDPLVTEPEKYGYVIIDGTNETEDQTISKILGELEKRSII